MRYSQTLLCSVDRRATAGTYPSRQRRRAYELDKSALYASQPGELKGERQPLQQLTICPQAKVLHFQSVTRCTTVCQKQVCRKYNPCRTGNQGYCLVVF